MFQCKDDNNEIQDTNWIFFSKSCKSTRPLCGNHASGAYVPATTVCSQRLDNSLLPNGAFSLAFNNAFH